MLQSLNRALTRARWVLILLTLVAVINAVPRDTDGRDLIRTIRGWSARCRDRNHQGRRFTPTAST